MYNDGDSDGDPGRQQRCKGNGAEPEDEDKETALNQDDASDERNTEAGINDRASGEGEQTAGLTNEVPKRESSNGNEEATRAKELHIRNESSGRDNIDEGKTASRTAIKQRNSDSEEAVNIDPRKRPSDRKVNAHNQTEDRTH
jgi:hypothetical protein